jgi:hypothetical protein
MIGKQPLMRLAAHPVTHEKGGLKTRQWITTAVRPWLGVVREPSPAWAAQHIFGAGDTTRMGIKRL